MTGKNGTPELISMLQYVKETCIESEEMIRKIVGKLQG